MAQEYDQEPTLAMRLGAGARRLDACLLAGVPVIISMEDRILPGHRT
jgi:hypothetical protein